MYRPRMTNVLEYSFVASTIVYIATVNRLSLRNQAAGTGVSRGNFYTIIFWLVFEGAQELPFCVLPGLYSKDLTSFILAFL